MIELLPSHIDGNKIFADEENKLEVIDLRDCHYMNAMTRTVSIENKTKNKVEFEWVFENPKYNNFIEYDTDTKQKKEQDFRIEPKEGFFQGKEIKTFTIKFAAQSLIPSYDKINLTIRNIPLESVKNPPSHILERINALKNEKKDSFAEALVSDKKIEFVYYTWQLIGDVSKINYSIDPPLLIIPYLQPIGKMHNANFVLRNHSQSPSHFSIHNVFKNSPVLNSQIISVTKVTKPSIHIDPENNSHSQKSMIQNAALQQLESQNNSQHNDSNANLNDKNSSQNLV